MADWALEAKKQPWLLSGGVLMAEKQPWLLGGGILVAEKQPLLLVVGILEHRRVVHTNGFLRGEKL